MKKIQVWSNLCETGILAYTTIVVSVIGWFIMIITHGLIQYYCINKILVEYDNYNIVLMLINMALCLYLIVPYTKFVMIEIPRITHNKLIELNLCKLSDFKYLPDDKVVLYISQDWIILVDIQDEMDGRTFVSHFKKSHQLEEYLNYMKV